MKNELQMVKDFHSKFGYALNENPTLIDKDKATVRHKIMKEEVEEYLAGAESDDLPNIAKELCDILYTTYGTIVAHGLQDVITEVFAEVHQSNMSKEINKEATTTKPVKGPDYFEPDLDQFFR